MARWARVVVASVPHHVTQRGTRRQPVFFNEDDYQTYLRLRRRHNRTGRPLGDADLIRRLEQTTGRNLRPQKPGPRGHWKHRQDSQNE